METEIVFLLEKYNSVRRVIACHDPNYKLCYLTFNVQIKFILDCMVLEKHDHFI